MHRVILGVVAVALLAAACGGEDTAAACTADGYGVEYPPDWHQERCAYFDREAFEVPEATEFFDVAVLVSREPVPLEIAAGEDRTRTILEREETKIAGRPAVRLEAETTGEGLLDRGVRYYQVLVSADGETVFLSTYEVPGLDYERNKEAVDELADGLRLTD